ncbi:chaplin [Streptomyces sp. NPDC091272]|uniref:chaplin n=1 Tax=Streptomyces sp. NPDC091272 TaxID=3365981 RepID=UPI0037F20913
MNAAKKAAFVLATAGLAAGAAAGTAAADSEAEGIAANSPGVISGNQVQVPLHVPVNVSGNTVNVIGVLNPAFGNEASND